MLYFIMYRNVYFIIYVAKRIITSMCREKTSSTWIEIDDLHKLEKSNGLEMLQIFIYCFYKKLLLKTKDILIFLKKVKKMLSISRKRFCITQVIRIFVTHYSMLLYLLPPSGNKKK